MHNSKQTQYSKTRSILITRETHAHRNSLSRIPTFPLERTQLLTYPHSHTSHTSHKTYLFNLKTHLVRVLINTLIRHYPPEIPESSIRYKTGQNSPNRSKICYCWPIHVWHSSIRVWLCFPAQSMRNERVRLKASASSYAYAPLHTRIVRIPTPSYAYHQRSLQSWEILDPHMRIACPYAYSHVPHTRITRYLFHDQSTGRVRPLRVPLHTLMASPHTRMDKSCDRP